MTNPADILDKKKFRSKVVLGLLSSPTTIVPLLGGVTWLAGIWALGLVTGPAIFGGFACITAAAGAFFTRLLLGGGAIAKEALREIQQELAEAQQRKLDELRTRLGADLDTRDDKLFDELLAVTAVFQQGPPGAKNLNQAVLSDILEKAYKLYEGCIANFTRSLEILDTVHRFPKGDAREAMIFQREKLLQEIQTSIGYLGRILAEIQDFKLPIDEGANLARIRSELDETIAVARRVEERLNDWGSDYNKNNDMEGK